MPMKVKDVHYYKKQNEHFVYDTMLFGRNVSNRKLHKVCQADNH